ncbi:MAG: hypothetical protein QXU32_01470 [Nitrososphaerales archaeon]
MALNPWKGIPYVEEFLNSLGILIRRNNTDVGKQPALNFIEGSQIGITAVEDSINQEVDVTINLLPNNPIQFGDLILRGTIANRPSPNIDGRLYFSTDENKLYRDSGAAWQQMIVDESTPITYGTSFPSSPKDGDIHVLVDSATAPAYQWQFRYNNGSSHSQKWEFIGGVPAYEEVLAAEATSSTTYTNLTTPGPSITLPRPGVYVVEIGYSITHNGAGVVSYMSYDIGSTGATDSDAVIGASQGAGGDAGSYAATRIKTVSSSLTLTAKYRVSSATSNTFSNRWIRVVPRRVS